MPNGRIRGDGVGGEPDDGGEQRGREQEPFLLAQRLPEPGAGPSAKPVQWRA
jgi:hypothetical protein